MNIKEYRILMLILIGTLLVIVGFIMEFCKLKEFQRCYYNDFKSKSCIKYKKD